MRFWGVALFCFLSIIEALSQGDVGSIISRTQFDQMLKHRNDAACLAKGFYTYDAFVSAAKSFGAFGTTGATDIRKREIAAFWHKHPMKPQSSITLCYLGSPVCSKNDMQGHNAPGEEIISDTYKGVKP
ncbi:unnamed protein product [Ilex paraguariensis]|uniref:Glycoside hydrolase family 19 catalytic domain-containing protein n=1 Tax=Ilex paraguariensis TaxID=185542 RepID=A0ABC8SJ46_9AQUA